MKTTGRLVPLAVSWLAACSFPMAAGATGPGPVDSTISVSGSASADIEPDLVKASFGVEVQDGTAAGALAANSESMARVIEAVRQAGIDDEEISTSQFNIHPVYEHHQDRPSGVQSQALVGYRVSNIVNVETGHLDRIAGIIDAAVGAGANRVDGVAFTLSPRVRGRLEETLIEAAVRDAREKAELALAPLGYVVSGVRQVSLSEHPPPAPLYAETARMDMARSAPTQIFAADQEVRTTVYVTFLAEPADRE
jgi:uncharacterized protein YggE